jgi:hypothetical protein
MGREVDFAVRSATFVTAVKSQTRRSRFARFKSRRLTIRGWWRGETARSAEHRRRRRARSLPLAQFTRAHPRARKRQPPVSRGIQAPCYLQRWKRRTLVVVACGHLRFLLDSEHEDGASVGQKTISCAALPTAPRPISALHRWSGATDRLPRCCARATHLYCWSMKVRSAAHTWPCPP